MPELVQVDEVAVPDAAYRPEWRECTVIFRLQSGRVLALDGWRYGTLVVHATWHDPCLRPFTVAHLPSKDAIGPMAVCRFAEVEQATTAVERLWQECPNGWAADIRTLPASVIQYCKENLQ